MSLKYSIESVCRVNELQAVVFAVLLTAAVEARGQTVDVDSDAEWIAAMAQAAAGEISTINITGSFSPSVQQVINANLMIQGNGYTLDMGQANGGLGDRALFIAGGTVEIFDLTIQNGLAVGGMGVVGGGGGAGLGGAIFVGSGSYLTGNGTVVSGFSTPDVTLTNVSFLTNRAEGGKAQTTNALVMTGGGGGMGGAGGAALGDSSNGGGGGGGGLGVTATGGAQEADPAPSDGGAGVLSLGGLSGGNGGSGSDTSGGTGGASAGGGGGGGGGTLVTGSGGGGGLGGTGGTYQNFTPPDDGGSGGFGGGGGGAILQAGAGGFGGGGGAGGDGKGGGPPPEGGEGIGDYLPGVGGAGGFGGGGGGNNNGTGNPNNYGAGGFGAGDGAQSGGGGGLGAGGAVFVMAGATLTVRQTAGETVDFSGNSVGSGAGVNAGSAIGADLFLGADAIFDLQGTAPVIVNGLGGAGDPTDRNVTRHATDPNAQGGIVVQGGGTLELRGESYYVGQTQVQQGAMVLGSAAKEVGTSSIVVGTTGDATLSLRGNSNLAGAAGATLTLGGAEGVKGVLNLGGGDSGVLLEVAEVTSGGGSGVINFDMATAYGNEASDTNAFGIAISGDIAVHQKGTGVVVLGPASGANTYTGGTEIEAGTLQLLNGSSLPTTGDVRITGGTLDINGQYVTAGVLVLSGGTLEDSKQAGSITTTSISATSGTISASIDGSGTLTKTSSGALRIAAANLSSGAVSVQAGSVELAVQGALYGTTEITLEKDATLALEAAWAIGGTAAFIWKGKLEMVFSQMEQTIGATTVYDGAMLEANSFMKLSLDSLSLLGGLVIKNWDSAKDELWVLNGIQEGSASMIGFYDAYDHYLGYGELVGKKIEIVAVPEPASWAGLALSAAALAVWHLRLVRKTP